MENSISPKSDEQPLETFSWFQVWIFALTRPSEETYTRLIKDPNAGFRRTISWIVLGSIIQISIAIAKSYSKIPELICEFARCAGQADQTLVDLAFLLPATLICLPILVIIILLLFMMFTSIIQLISGLIFKGAGVYSDLTYAITASAVPISLILRGVNAIQYGKTFSFLLYLYLGYLTVLAVKTTNRFGWVKALATFIVPMIVVIGIVFIVVILVAILGNQLFDFFGV